jgi:hypothetical protein
MRLLLTFVAACVALAAVKIAVTALALLLLIALIWGTCLHPKEMAGFLTLCACLSVFKAHPLPCLAVIGAAVIAVQIARQGKSHHDDS